MIKIGGTIAGIFLAGLILLEFLILAPIGWLYIVCSGKNINEGAGI